MKVRLHWLLILPALFADARQSAAQGTAFTYNGMLNDSGNPGNGGYDLSFSLYNAASNGSWIGSVTNSATGVSNGLFTVTLDFGGVFNGSNYWLEIAVRTNGGGPFITLSPRQPITPAPYAIYAPSAGSAATALIANTANSVSAANLSGTIPSANLGNAVALIQTSAANGSNFTRNQIAAFGQTLWPKTIFVSTSGSDTNAGTNLLAPVQTISNALFLASNLQGSVLVKLGAGNFPLPANTYIGANIAMMGEGASQTALTFNPASFTGYLFAAGDNVCLKGFTLGTNSANGMYYFPLVLVGGTNFYAEGIGVNGDSDAIVGTSTYPLANLFAGEFFNCAFSSGYDTVALAAPANAGPGTNSVISFEACNFNVNADGSFPAILSRHGIWLGTGNVLVRSCVFNITNSVNSAVVNAMEVGLPAGPSASIPTATVNDNVYNVTNISAPGNQNGILLYPREGTAVLNVVGAINPANINNAAPSLHNVSGTVNYDAIQASYFVGTVGASNLTGSIPLARLGGEVLTNTQKGVTLSGTFRGLGSGLTNSAGNPLVRPHRHERPGGASLRAGGTAAPGRGEGEIAATE